MVGDGCLNKTEGGRKEGKGGKDLFRIGVFGNRSLNKTEGRSEEGREKREGRIHSGFIWLAKGT